MIANFTRSANVFSTPVVPPTPTPTRDQPGSWQQQIEAVRESIRLANENGSFAWIHWQDARKLVIPHARGGDDQ